MSKHSAGHDDYNSPMRPGLARIENPSEHDRERILTDDEVRALWKACEGQGTFGNFCKMLLLTAQRRTKVSTMKWDDLSDDTWTIATETREKGNAKRLKLPKAALVIIEAQRELLLNDFVFPAATVAERDKPGQYFGSLTAFSQGKAALDKRMLEELHSVAVQRNDKSMLAFVAKIRALFADIAAEKDDKAKKKLKAELKRHWWILHDLRRTARSLMSRAKVRPDLAERVLGHVIKGVEGIYDRHTYDNERAQALVALSMLIARILEPRRSGNVVPISR
ncbi:hypothetical protein [Bradyrhizobium viridifuturi]|uniref:hypothetical protein n=1 Tax=Bradyrhizobium viridifuturi TaxID=1654716 RepID=UPI001AEBD47C|nr:hypothetical protein [Bradyrhizobium viridifuturi]